MKAAKRSGASPGGPAVSAAKRRRLAALDDALSGAAPRARSTSAPAAEQGLPQPAVANKALPGAVAEPASGDGEFPYNRLGDAVVDGSLSAALAHAKAAAAAAAEAAGPAGGGIRTASVAKGSGNTAIAVRSSSAMQTAAAAVSAVAAAAAAGGDSVAAEILVQLMATNPRTSSSDLRGILAQRLQDRSVMLDNPTAPVKASRLFARRGTKFSARLRCTSRAKDRDLHPAQPAKRTPSYEAMLRVHELWLQYTQNLARSATATGAAAASSNSGAGGGTSAHAADLHGAMLTVVKHPNPQLVGATGVLLKRSSSSLHLVTPGDRVRVIALKGCIAHYNVNGTTVRLAG
ncbi:hypothetical protein PLESTB_000466200 [Pleodorina starrii]|uniref:Uncharacterized protein n=1 Tax=Pleodorina starrii TaxID=330485 RepID=A0A9W6EZI6_9CHLO|nr:hypothetical protein PLESTM_000800700 [Pleodorina starrii]GLC51103.1 hypothetical protein PLESTB_000466200 [Pleodorina starrii]GLC63461.1 hypothetical protein PLESTF_000038700 [Pleodorina starrii]